MAFGLSVAYLLLLVFLVFQSFNDIKAGLRWIDPERLSRWKLEEKVGNRRTCTFTFYPGLRR
jgi:hypothetical protein